MVLRRFPAFDNEAFTVAAGSPSLTPGSPIINNADTPVGTLFEFTAGFEYKSIQVDDTSGDPDIFEDNQSSGHIITDGMGIVDDGTPVESESFHFIRELDEFGNEIGPVITLTVFSQNGQQSSIWGMAADAPLKEDVIYKKTAGSNKGDSEYSDFVPCFVQSTVMAAPEGERLIETLRAGDRLITRDHGIQEIAWIGRKDLSPRELASDERLLPIRIRAGALGPDYPAADLIVSPNHRVLMKSAEHALNFGSPEVFVAAKFLVDRPGVEVLRGEPVSYFHILFERHEVVLSNSTWTESFLPGPQALSGVDRDQRDEVLLLFPELSLPEGVAWGAGPFQAARRVLTRREALLHA
ncbi:MAG: Hint domain-containing protein [Pseudomonadota bacterium]